MERIGGKAYIVVGATGSGKSTLIKKMIAKVPVNALHIYDVNAEYFPHSVLPPLEQFLKTALSVREKVIICEEATIFFSNRGNDRNTRELLVRKRHTQNTIIFVFHSVRSIPHYIYDLCNAVFLFRTNDSEDLVKNKTEMLYPAFMKVQNKFFKYGQNISDFCEIIKLN